MKTWWINLPWSAATLCVVLAVVVFCLSVLAWEWGMSRRQRRRQQQAAATREARRAKREADARKWGLAPLELPAERHHTTDQAGTFSGRDRRGLLR
jgi:type II secretory pathway pseudopilin PulG